MKLYIETLFIPNILHLDKPKQETQHLIICEEGIIFHGVTDQKLVIHNQLSTTLTHTTHLISNIKLIEDKTKTSLKPIYNIPLNHHMITLNLSLIHI